MCLLPASQAQPRASEARVITFYFSTFKIYSRRELAIYKIDVLCRSIIIFILNKSIDWRFASCACGGFSHRCNMAASLHPASGGATRG